MRGLTIVVGDADPGRYRTALMLAAAQAAAGGAARLYLNERAVGLLATEADAPGPGLPTLGQLQDEALALGVRVTACQSGLALVGLDASSLDPRIETGGMVGLVTSLGEDRLVVV